MTRVFTTTFSLVVAEDADDVRLEELTIDGNDPKAPFLYGWEGGAVYFYHVNRPVIRNCIARNFPGTASASNMSRIR